MWPTNVSPVERREAERRVKAVLFFSMMGLLVGLMVATYIESVHQAPPRSHPASVPSQLDETSGRTQ